jgi:hypothetical protein
MNETGIKRDGTSVDTHFEGNLLVRPRNPAFEREFRKKQELDLVSWNHQNDTAVGCFTKNPVPTRICI